MMLEVRTSTRASGDEGWELCLGICGGGRATSPTAVNDRDQERRRGGKQRLHHFIQHLYIMWDSVMLYRSSFLESCVLISTSYDDNALSSTNLATTLPRLQHSSYSNQVKSNLENYTVQGMNG